MRNEWQKHCTSIQLCSGKGQEKGKNCGNLSRNYIVAVNIFNVLFTSSLPFYICPEMQFYYTERFMGNISVVFHAGGNRQCNYDKHWLACHLLGMLQKEKGKDAQLDIELHKDSCNNVHFYFKRLWDSFEKNKYVASLCRFPLLPLARWQSCSTLTIWESDTMHTIN